MDTEEADAGIAVDKDLVTRQSLPLKGARYVLGIENRERAHNKVRLDPGKR